MVIDPAAFPFLVEHLADVVWVFDPRTQRMVYANPAVADFLGYTSAEVTGIGLRDLVAVREWPLVEEHLASCIEDHFFSGRPFSKYSRELEHRHKAGHSVWGEARMTIVGTARETLRIVGVTRDLTEKRRRAEAGGLVRNLLEGAPVGAFLSVKRRVVWANPQALQLIGAPSLDAVVGRETLSLVAEEDRSRARERYRVLAVEGGRPLDEVVRLHRFDGSTAPFEVSSVRVSLGAETANVIFARAKAIGPASDPEAAVESPFWKLAAGLPEVLIILQNERIVYANSAATKLLRATAPEDLLGWELERFVSPEFRTLLRQQLSSAHGTDAPTDHAAGKCQLLPREGGPVPVDTTVLRMNLDGVPSVLFLARDLSRHHAATERHWECEARLRDRYREVPIAIGVVHHRRIVDANPMLGRLLGFPPGEPVDLPAEQLYADKDEFDRVGRDICLQMAAQGEARVTTRWRRRDARLVDVELHTIWLFPEREGQWMLCVAQDVSCWAGLQRESAANAAELQAMFDAAPVMYFLVDGAGICRRINGAAQSFTGCSNAEALGQQVDKVLQCACLVGQASPRFAHGCNRCVLRQTIRRAADGIPTLQAEVSLELMLEGSASEHALLISAAALRQEPGADVLLCIEDITQQRHLAEQVRHAQRLDEVGRMAAGIAHDFNSIFFALAVHLSSLQNSGGLAPGLRKALADLEDQARLGNKLCQKLLFLGQQQAPCPVRVEVGTIVHQALNCIRHLLAGNIRVTAALPSQPMHVLGDAGMLEQILINLCLNARDAMPDGGELSIRTESLLCEATMRGQPPFPRTGLFVVMVVSDTGCGMDPAVLARIFDPFFTTKDARRGTGLGLTTVQTIVQRHEGWIEVRSKPGRGTIFEVGLPAAPENS